MTHERERTAVGDANACDPECVEIVMCVPELQPQAASELLRLRSENTDRVAEAHVSASRIVAVWHHDLCVFFVTRTSILA